MQTVPTSIRDQMVNPVVLTSPPPPVPVPPMVPPPPAPQLPPPPMQHIKKRASSHPMDDGAMPYVTEVQVNGNLIGGSGK